MEENAVSGVVVDAAMRVHTVLGPRLLESIYGMCLAHELRQRGLPVRVEVPVPSEYAGLPIDAGFRLDLFVQDRVVVEAKAVHRLPPGLSS